MPLFSSPGIALGTLISKGRRRSSATRSISRRMASEIDKPIDVSNVAVISPSDGKPTRVGYKLVDGKKVRICKRTGAELS